MNWISVKERMPDKDQEVLFFDANYQHIELGNFMGTDWHPFWADTYLNAKHITRWMPLPDPPVIIECSETFTYDSHTCTPCKHYGECVTATYLQYAQQAPSP